MRNRDRARMGKDLRRIRDDLTKTIRRVQGEDDPTFLKACAVKLNELSEDLRHHGGVLELEALAKRPTLEVEPTFEE